MSEETQQNDKEKVETRPTVTEAEKEAFFRSFITDTPFEWEEKVMDGALAIKFTALSTQQTMAVYDILKEEQSSGELTNDVNYMSKITIYRLVQSLVSVNGVPFAPDKTVKEKAEVVAAWPAFKLSVFCDSFRSFEDKIVTLTKEVTTENFWKAASQSS